MKGNEMTTENIHTALAAAQATMDGATKDTANQFFKSKYADLSSVMRACMPALTANGISVTQPIEQLDGMWIVKTILTHGKSDTFVSGLVPLIVSKNDMQGFGSAHTYARRYGLMAMAGIAPEEDDGNAAAENPPTPTVQKLPTINDTQFIALKDKVDEWGGPLNFLLKGYGAKSLEEFPADKFDAAIAALNTRISEARTPDETDGPKGPQYYETKGY